MKKIKKLMVLFVVSLFVISNVQPASAAENSGSGNSLNTIDLNNPSDNVIVSDILTYDEIVEIMAKDMDISLEEAANIVTGNFYNTPLAERAAISPQLASYRTLKQPIENWDYRYTPSIQFYCETSEGGGYAGIVQVLSTNLIRTDPNNFTAKFFTGTVFTHLENAGKIHYIIDGDWYDYATNQGISGGGSIKIGGKTTLNFTASSSNKFFGNMLRNGDLYWGNI